MSITRHDVNQLFLKLQERSRKLQAVRSDMPPDHGLQALENRLKYEEGQDKPSLALRQMAQLTKHYLEELEGKAGRADPCTVLVNYNIAISLLGKGFDVQYCIRRARAGTTDAERELQQLGIGKSDEDTAALNSGSGKNREKKPDRRKQAARDEVPDLP